MSLINQTATELLTQLRDESLTPLDLLDALEQRIAEVDGVVNALPTRCFGRARSHARELMKKPVKDRGLLCGLPVAIKDLESVSGVLTTYGSQIFKDFVPEGSDCLLYTSPSPRDRG